MFQRTWDDSTKITLDQPFTANKTLKTIEDSENTNMSNSMYNLTPTTGTYTPFKKPSSTKGKSIKRVHKRSADGRVNTSMSFNNSVTPIKSMRSTRSKQTNSVFIFDDRTLTP